MLDNLASNAKELKRLNLQFEDYNLKWENIPVNNKTITSSSNTQNKNKVNIAPSNASYVKYTDFEAKVRNKENVVGKKIILEKIYFATGSDEILTNSNTQLNHLANLMQTNNNLKVEVSGHTDNVGDDVQNMVLSQKRADAIKYYLMGKSIESARITCVGKGSTLPISENNVEEGRRQNRRVEIQIVE